MDGRGALRLSVYLLIAAAGCQHQVLTVPNPAPNFAAGNLPPVPDLSQVKKVPAKPKNLPPSVLVSYGDFQAGEAFDPSIAPDRQQQLCELARTYYEKALKLDPKYVPAYQGLARLHVALRDHPLAVETYQKALKIAPNNAALWYELGMCHNYQKNWGPALDCLSRAARIDPGNRSYVNAMGVVLAEAGRYEDSLNCFIRSSGEALGCYRLAQTLQRLQQPELSRRYLEMALQKDPSLATTLAMRNGGNDAANPAPSPLQQTAYQAAAYQAPNAPPAQAAPATPPAIPPDASDPANQPAQQQVILLPPPPINGE